MGSGRPRSPPCFLPTCYAGPGLGSDGITPGHLWRETTAPKDVHALIPRSLGHVRSRGKRRPSLLTSRLRDGDIIVGTRCNQSQGALKVEEGGADTGKAARGLSPHCRRKGPRNVTWAPREAGEGLELGAPRGPAGACGPDDTSMAAQRGPCQTSDLRDCQKMNSCGFKPLTQG